MKIKDFQLKNYTFLANRKKTWNWVHMDHAYINGIGQLLILVDSFSGWTEMIEKQKR